MSLPPFLIKSRALEVDGGHVVGAEGKSGLRVQVDEQHHRYMTACAAAWHDGRRNAVLSALGTMKRIRVTDAIEDYTRLLIKKRERRQGANPSGRNSHAQNVRLILLKIMRTLNAPEDVTYLDELSLGRVSTYLDTSNGSPKTLRGHKSALDGLINFARQKEWLSSDPLEVLDSPELRHEAIRWVRREDFPGVLEALEGHPAQLPVALIPGCLLFSSRAGSAGIVLGFHLPFSLFHPLLIIVQAIHAIH